MYSEASLVYIPGSRRREHWLPLLEEGRFMGLGLVMSRFELMRGIILKLGSSVVTGEV